jgi:hypothetical protein
MNTQMIKLCFLFAFFLSVAQALFAQQYTLEGNVTGPQAEPVAGAVVVLQVSDSLVGSAMVNNKGGFVFTGLSKGDYRLAVSAADFQPLEETVTLQSNRKVSYTLLPVRQVDLEGIEVTAARSNAVKTLATGTAFYLSQGAKNATNPYEALLEIPQLAISPSDRTVKMANGSTPLILINGVRTGAGLNAVDPKDIESVEVIDFPSARYLQEGVTAVLNIRVKRKSLRYQTINASTRHSLPLLYGVSNLYAETGGPNHSLYLIGQHFYFDKDKQIYSSEQSGPAYYKYAEREGAFNMQSFYAALGGDYVFSDRDYLSFSITYINSPTTIDSQGEGLLNESAFGIWNKDRVAYYVNTYNLYHKHDFGAGKLLETTFRFNLNGNRTQGEQHESYEALPPYDYVFDYDNSRLSSSLEVNYHTAWGKQSLDLGSRTSYLNDRLHPRPLPAFRYREWAEYLYGDLSGSLGQAFLYSVSLGADMIFNRIEETDNHYLLLCPAVSVRYNLKPSQSLGLAYRINNQAPTSSILNPYNTSADSLYRVVGNPYLVPIKLHSFSVNYSFSRSGLYLSPDFTYTLAKDDILAVGRMEGDVFTQTYANEGSYTGWTGSLTLQYNNNRWGNIGGSVGYKRTNYPQIERGSFYANANFYLRYKKLSANGNIFYQQYYYSPVYVTQMYAPESELTLNWALNNRVTLQAGLRYFLGGMKQETIMDSKGYYSKLIQQQADRRYVVSIGVSYNWRSKVQTPYRNKKQLNQQESGISLDR